MRRGLAEANHDSQGLACRTDAPEPRRIWRNLNVMAYGVPVRGKHQIMQSAIGGSRGRCRFSITARRAAVFSTCR
jgi:hypothetical protein